MKHKANINSLITEFKVLKAKHPALGNVVVLAMLVKGKKLDKEVIEQLLNSSCRIGVDYFDSKTEIIQWLHQYSNTGKIEKKK